MLKWDIITMSQESELAESWNSLANTKQILTKLPWLNKISKFQFNIVYTGVLQIFHMKTQWDIESFAFDEWWKVVIKSYQNKWVVLGQELTENNLKG
jgi:hypothetical protein